LGGVGCIVGTPDTVVNVFAKGFSIGLGIVAGFEAKGVVANEAVCRGDKYDGQSQKWVTTYRVQRLDCSKVSLLPPLLGNALE